MNNEKISIIVPIYNADRYVSRCIESIVNQTYKDIQIILVNDGSTDESGDICDSYATEDSRIIVIHKENAGVAEARNAGLKVADGLYVGFVDADDYIEADMYAILLKNMLDTDSDICCSGYIQEYKDFHYNLSADNMIILNGTQEILSHYLRQDIRSGIGDGNWNKLFKKEVLDGIEYKKYANGEDVEFQVEAFMKCKRMTVIPNLLYHYAVNENSATASEFKEKQASILVVADKIKELVCDRFENLSDQAYAFQLTWYLSLLQKICRSKRTPEGAQFKRLIIKVLRKDYDKFSYNPYSKRLDQFYLKAAKFGMMKQAMIFRDIVRIIKPSKDKIVS